MMKQQRLHHMNMTKWICLALCGLLCAALLGVPVREARAAAAGITALPANIAYGQEFTLTASAETDDSPVKALAAANPFVWTVDGTVLTKKAEATDNVNARTSALTLIASSVGGSGSVSCTINYANGTSDTVEHTNVAVGKATPTVTVSLETAGAKLYPGGNVQLKATVSPSGIQAAGTITWNVPTSATGITLDTNGKVTAADQITSGTIGVTASFTPGTADAANYNNSAPSAAFSVSANPIPRTVSVTNPGALVSGSGDTTLTATASPAIDAGLDTLTWHGTASGTGVTFDAATGKITVADNAVGSVADIYAEVAARGNYAAATSEPNKFTVQVAPRTAVVTGMPTSAALAVHETATLSTGVTSDNTKGTITYVISDVVPADCIVLTDAATGKIRADAVGTAKVTFTQAAGDNRAEVTTGNGPVCNITVGNPTLTFNPASVTITADKGTQSVTARVLYAGTATFAPVTLSGYDSNIILVKSTSSSNGSNTFTITARAKGTTNITATVDGTTMTATLPVTVNYANASYFTIDSWYHYLKYDRRYTEITAILHNPGNGVDPGARTYWALSNNVSKAEWSNEYLQYDANTNTYFTRLRVKAMRNGTTTAYLGTANNIGASYEYHVTSMSYIPQSGQDSTAIYVVGALLMVSAAATVTVFAYRRKRSRS